MTIVVGTTIAPWKCDGRQELAWLDTAEEIADSHEDVSFFAALEVDGRGLSPYVDLLRRITDVAAVAVPVDYWRFAIDDGTKEVTTGERLVRICAGRNLCHEYAMRDQSVTHILFVDSDISIPGDSIPKMLEVDHPVVGGLVGIYAQDGPKLDKVEDAIYRVARERSQFPDTEAGGEAWLEEQRFCLANPWFIDELGTFPEDADIREHWCTAGFLLVRRDVFSTVAWHWDLDRGCTDDPAFQNAVERAGFGRTWTRHDLLAEHEPLRTGMVAVEHRDGDRMHVPW